MANVDLDLEGLVRELRKRPLDLKQATAVEHGTAAIERLLPHRPPMLLVDSVHAVDLAGRRVAGRFTLRAEDPVFRGHFPGQPVYPGVLQIEAMGQLGLCLAHFLTRGTTDIGADAEPVAVRALRVLHAQYLEPLFPGDVLELRASILEEDGMTATSTGQILKDGKIASYAVQEVYFVE
jgi:3-hydroxymyristoyl/3-hydroxydecanoyl-(acyl carrier protein) dehydratase